MSESKNPKSKAILDEMTRLLEKWSVIGHFTIAIMTPICILCPNVIISYVVYFTTDAGNEAFELPLPAW